VYDYTNELARNAALMFEKAWGTKVFQGDQAHYGRMPIIPLPNGDSVSDMVAKTLMAYLQSAENITAFLPFIPIEFVLFSAFFSHLSIFSSLFFTSVFLVLNSGKKTLCLRLSCQIYNTMEEYEKLADVISKMKGNYNIVSLAVDVAREYLS